MHRAPGASSERQNGPSSQTSGLGTMAHPSDGPKFGLCIRNDDCEDYLYPPSYSLPAKQFEGVDTSGPKRLTQSHGMPEPDHLRAVPGTNCARYPAGRGGTPQRPGHPIPTRERGDERVLPTPAGTPGRNADCVGANLVFAPDAREPQWRRANTRFAPTLPRAANRPLPRAASPDQIPPPGWESRPDPSRGLRVPREGNRHHPGAADRRPRRFRSTSRGHGKPSATLGPGPREARRRGPSPREGRRLIPSS